MIRPLALDKLRMAQDVVSGQGFHVPPPLPGGARIVPHRGHLFTLGFTRRLALQLGHFALMRAGSLSLLISTEESTASDAAWFLENFLEASTKVTGDKDLLLSAVIIKEEARSRIIMRPMTITKPTIPTILRPSIVATSS